MCQKEGEHSSLDGEDTHLKGNSDKVCVDKGLKVFELDTGGLSYWEMRGKGLLYRRAW